MTEGVALGGGTAAALVTDPPPVVLSHSTTSPDYRLSPRGPSSLASAKMFHGRQTVSITMTARLVISEKNPTTCESGCGRGILGACCSWLLSRLLGQPKTALRRWGSCSDGDVREGQGRSTRRNECLPIRKDMCRGAVGCWRKPNPTTPHRYSHVKPACVHKATRETCDFG